MRSFLTSALFAFALAFGFAQPAQAQHLQIAMCGEGGCLCHMTGKTIADFEMTMGVKAPRDAASLTLVTRAGEYFWSNKTPAQIDAAHGGPGHCPVHLEMPLIPQDGQWRITVGTTDTTACPLFAMMGQSVPGQISGETREIKWGGSFSPDKLMAEARGMVTWSHSGNHNWRGVVVDKSLSGQSGASGASVIWTLQLISPTEIKGSSTFDFDISATNADAAALAILNQMQCRTVTPFTARKVG
jgi:hypothetical protein